MKRHILRAVLVAALFGISTYSGSAFGGQFTSVPTDLENTLYSQAIVCFVANGHAKGTRMQVGDTAKAAIYEKQAHEAFNIAVTAGRDMGFSKDRIEDDFARIQAAELPQMVNDQSYFFNAVAKCKALKFM
jgi:hypothetical protein